VRKKTGTGARGVQRSKAPWLVLWLGFGGLLACIVGAAVGTIGALDRVRYNESLTRKAFFERLSALDQIRAQIYLSGTYVRDFLLAPDSTVAAAQASRLGALQSETQARIQAYALALGPADREPFQALQAEIDSYWRVLDSVSQWTPEERNRRRDSFFYDELVPRRNAMLQIADRIALANEHALNRAESQLTASAANLRRSLVVTFAVTLVGGLLLALLTIAYTLRLERELERRLEENARARADLQELSAKLLRAQENERRSLARELHDEIGSSLSAILMEAGSAECADTLGEARDHLGAIRTLAEKTVNEVRDLALLLRPSMLDDFGLVPALNWHAREMTKRTGLRVALSADDAADELPDEHKTCIYRLVQEAVNNSARHAGARNVKVDVRRHNGQVLFSVRDDGSGFDPRSVRGLGLLGMEERVRRLGGKLTIDSHPGRGTTVAAELPVEPGSGPENGDHAHPHPAG
jgi:signal transduction histidine kinase